MQSLRLPVAQVCYPTSGLGSPTVVAYRRMAGRARAVLLPRAGALEAAPRLCCWEPASASNPKFQVPTSTNDLGKPHYVSAVTEESKQQSCPARDQRTNPMISLDMPSRPTTPLSVTESKPSAVITDARAPARYFFDICAGRSAPLSVAAIKAGLAVLVPVDADLLLGGETHDLTDPNIADYVLQFTWSGSLGFAADAPRRSDPDAATHTQNFWQTENLGSKTTD